MFLEISLVLLWDKAYLSFICNVRRLFIILYFQICASTLSAQSLADAVKNFTSSPLLKGAHVGVLVMDAGTGKVMVEHNAEQLFIPASINKLATTALALQILGAEFRFQTPIYRSGKIIDSVLYGDIVLVGSGDPAIASIHFRNGDTLTRQLQRALKSASIRRVAGDILLYSVPFDRFLPPGSWAWGDMGNYYGSFPGAFNFSDNTYQLVFSSPDLPGKPAPVLSTHPPQTMRFVNFVQTSEVPRDNAWIMGAAYGDTRVLTGTIPNSRGTFSIKGAMSSPALQLGLHLRAACGTFFSDSTRINILDILPMDTVPLCVHMGPTVAEIAAKCNVKSINLFAEALLIKSALHLGISDYDGALGLLSQGSDRHIPSFYKDACGLSRANAMSPLHLAGLIHQVYHRIYFDQWISGWPVSGISGTMSSFGAGTALSGKYFAKTGSMERVRNIAGILKKGNKKLIVIVFCENFVCSPTELKMLQLNLLLQILKQ
jgi:D-alanyl-D-alanine carboxypeptidase/D-alanyl-D-alanine-endopeptidase (penicillin-binding protein 4)